MELTDKAIKDYARVLSTVMGDLESEVLGFMNSAGKTGPAAAATIINSRPAFLQMLKDSGFNDLSQAYVAKYGEIPGDIKKAFDARSLPKPEFTTISKETFQGMAKMDLQGFSAIGTKAMDDLRISIYRQAISGMVFKDIVDTVKAATTGTAKNGSPLSRYAYTHANTGILKFNGEVTQAAGESIGFDTDDSLWQIEGPVDAITRDVCRAALSDSVRTKAEWINIGYWGGTPGGWNCRHEFFPYFGN